MKKQLAIILLSTLAFASTNNNKVTIGYTHLTAYKDEYSTSYNIVKILNEEFSFSKINSNINSIGGFALKAGWNIQDSYYKIQQYEVNYGINYKIKSIDLYGLGLINYTHTNYQPTWGNEKDFNDMIGVGCGIGFDVKIPSLRRMIIDFRTNYIKYLGNGFNYSLDYQINVGTYF